MLAGEGFKSRVSVQRCENYEEASVSLALKNCLEPLGDITSFVKPGQKVLIKPNCLLGTHPDAAVTTHPALVAAVVKAVIGAGGIALVGDCPGNAYTSVEKALIESGIKPAVESAGGKIIYFQQTGITDVPSPSGNQRIPHLKIAKAVLEADVVINLPKLKTHMLTLYTGAIKNMFGSVPGFNKSAFHIRAPQPADFAASIVDVFEVTRPALNIMDAVVGMEGGGPSAGQPRKFGAILASRDAVALDSIASQLIGFRPEEIYTTLIAYRRGLGEINPEIIGTDIGELKQPDWSHPASARRLTRWLPGLFNVLFGLFSSQITIDPVIDQAKCTKCLVCVNNCPAKTIDYDKGIKKVEINLKNCIHCYCCHELCEYKAIDLRRSWLAKKLGF